MSYSLVILQCKWNTVSLCIFILYALWSVYVWDHVVERTNTACSLYIIRRIENATVYPFLLDITSLAKSMHVLTRVYLIQFFYLCWIAHLLQLSRSFSGNYCPYTSNLAAHVKESRSKSAKWNFPFKEGQRRQGGRRRAEVMKVRKVSRALSGWDISGRIEAFHSRIRDNLIVAHSSPAGLRELCKSLKITTVA